MVLQGVDMDDERDVIKNKSDFVVINGSGKWGKGRSSSPRQLSKTVNHINQKALQWLQARVDEVFAQVDDSLFSMAEKSHKQDEQDALFQAIRALRVGMSDITDAFCDGIEERFASPRNDMPGEEGSIGDSASGALSLIQDDDLEQQVAIRTMISNVKRDHAESIAALSLRLDTLFAEKIYDENLPLGPASICAAFADGLSEVDIVQRARMTVFKKFEVHLINRLGELYQACNALLVEEGVLPALEDPLRHRARRPGQSDRAPASGGAPTPDGEVPQGMAGGMPGAMNMQPGGSFQAGGMPQGGSAMAFGGGMAAGGQTGAGSMGLMPMGSGAAPIATPTLLQHLSQFQMAVPLQGGATGQLVDVNALLQDQLVKSQQRASLHELDSEVIRLVDMLFSFMLEDRNLAEPIKVQLIRLQLPLLKLAVADKAFFSKGGHPARRLLNELADAAIGWQPGKNYLDDPLYREICSIVEGVLEKFDRDERVFDEQLELFREFSARERKRAAVMERRTVDEAQGAARVEAAKARVAAVFDALTAERKLPKIVHEWLDRVWNSVLFRTCLKDGTDSGTWRQHVLTARNLVWSVVAPMPESSVKLQRVLPELRKRLDEGAQSLSLGGADRQRLVGGLDALYRERRKLAERVESERERRTRERLVQELRREADSVLAIADAGSEDHVQDHDLSVPETAEQPALPDVAQLEKAAAEAPLAKNDEARPLPEEDSHWLQTYHLKDSWFLLRQSDKLPMRCRLAAIIKDLDQFMFVNRQGAKVGVYSRLELAHALRKEELLPLEQGPLFERALSYVVGNCGESKIAIRV